MKKTKKWFCFTLAILLMFSTLPVGDFVIQSNAEGVPLYKKAILNIDLTKIRSVGCQNGGQACACFSLAYCTTILDDRVHYYSEYNTGTNQENANCNWSLGKFLNDFFPTNKNDAYIEMYKQIVTGNPVAVKVIGSRSKHHYVAVVGVENVANVNSLSSHNFLILDPAVSVFNLENMGGVGYDLKLENNVYQVVRNGTGKTVGLNSIEYISGSNHIEIRYDCHCRLEVTERDKHIMTLPCSNKTDTKSDSVEAVAKGDKLEAIELIFNSQDNYWYKVISEKTGKTGYIYAGNVKWIAHKTTDITGPGISVPANHTQGKAYPLSGSVTASNSELTKVSVYIYPGTKTSGTSETGYSQSVSGKSFSLGGSTIDKNTVFNILGVGQHTYVVKASCKYYYATSGTKKDIKTVENVLVYKQSFNVISGSSTPSVQHPTTIIYPTNGGIYKIASGVGNNMYLDFACTNKNVQIYENCDNHSDPNFVISQYFRLTHVGDGWYTIINIGNGKAMDIEGAVAGSGINIHQWETIDYDAQFFRFYDAGNGYCYIKSKLGNYVDVQNADNVNNTNVWTYTFNGSNAQQWQLISHKHSYTSKVIEPATCTKNGVKEYTCSGCLTSYRENIPAKGHSFGKWLPILFLSNTNEVKQAQTCSTCNHVQEQTVAVMMGDINGDRQVSVADARLVLRKAVGLESFSEVQTKLADVDFDKKVTVADARCILRASVGLEKLNNNGSIADAPIVVI